MKSTTGISLLDVKAVYNGSEGDLWELVMGHQVHIGGIKSSIDLAQKANIRKGTTGVDLCCCNGAGMRFLLTTRQVRFMYGVDAAQKVADRGLVRTREDKMFDRVKFIIADVCKTGITKESVDFVWGEDAWCYVEDKPALIKEAARLTKPGGTIAFTDWLEGPVSMTDDEAERFLQFMKFSNILNMDEYTSLLENNGYDLNLAEDTGRFTPSMDLYLNMLEFQFRSDALRIANQDADMLESFINEIAFTQKLAHENKVIQGIFVAQKPQHRLN